MEAGKASDVVARGKLDLVEGEIRRAWRREEATNPPSPKLPPEGVFAVPTARVQAMEEAVRDVENCIWLQPIGFIPGANSPRRYCVRWLQVQMYLLETESGSEIFEFDGGISRYPAYQYQTMLDEDFTNN